MPKPPKFQVGQAGASLCSATLHGVAAGVPVVIELVKGQVYHIAAIEDDKPGWSYTLAEVSNYVSIHEWALIPVELLPDEALAALLEETLTPVPA